MALITPSALISDIKGKIGGGVIQNTQGGLALRTKTTPVNRNTPRQERSRRDTFNLQNEWLNLTQAQRDDWQLWANTYPKPQIKNPLKNINGQQYFLKYNDYRARYNLPILKDLDWNVPTLDALEVNLFTLPGYLFVLANRRIDFLNEFLVLFITWEVSPGLNNPGNRYKMIVFNTNFWNNIVLSTEVSDVFGAIPATGSQVFVKVASFSRNTAYWTMFNEAKVTISNSFGIGSYIIGSTFTVFP